MSELRHCRNWCRENSAAVMLESTRSQAWPAQMIPLGRVLQEGATVGDQRHNDGRLDRDRATTQVSSTEVGAGLAGMALGPLVFGSLGYMAGTEADRVTIILTIAD